MIISDYTEKGILPIINVPNLLLSRGQFTHSHLDRNAQPNGKVEATTLRQPEKKAIFFIVWGRAKVWLLKERAVLIG